jgi:uncharacterized protein (TIGR02466 family)
MSISLSQSDTMGLSLMFPTFLGVSHYPDFAAERERLISRIRQISEEDAQGRQISRQHYPNGYTSYYTKNMLQGDSAFSPLVFFIRQMATQYAAQQYWDTERYEPVMSSLWCNINGQYSSHSEHLHPLSHISGVFYIDCPPNSGSIIFKDPRPGRTMVPPPTAEFRTENSMQVSVPPEDGKLLMFPSFLEHRVEQNLTTTERIGMSFNFDLRQRTVW